MMNQTAGETADVLLAADALDARSLNVLLRMFNSVANSPDGYSHAEREMFHSIARLLARIRDLHTEREKGLRRTERKAALLAGSEDSDLAEEFAAITANL